jgi:hypothetical protein
MRALVGTGESRGLLVVDRSAGARQASLRALRARHLSLVAAVEAQWGERFGTDLLTTIRTAAEAVAGRLDPELPGYVLVPWIGGTLSVHGAGGGQALGAGADGSG